MKEVSLDNISELCVSELCITQYKGNFHSPGGGCRTKHTKHSVLVAMNIPGRLKTRILKAATMTRLQWLTLNGRTVCTLSASCRALGSLPRVPPRSLILNNEIINTVATPPAAAATRTAPAAATRPSAIKWCLLHSYRPQLHCAL